MFILKVKTNIKKWCYVGCGYIGDSKFEFIKPVKSKKILESSKSQSKGEAAIFDQIEFVVEITDY